MQSFTEKARVYMVALMKAGGFTVENVATVTDSSASTIKNFLSGKTSKNPGFDHITNWILALGGDMNELVGYEKKKDIETNSVITIKESFEIRMEDLVSACEKRVAQAEESCEKRIAQIEASCEKRIEDIYKCCEIRISDMKQHYEERLKEIKEYNTNPGRYCTLS